MQMKNIFSRFTSIYEMHCGSAAVVQRYIERPLLIAGYKFDLRLYVCVPSYRPLIAYMYAEGLARFGTDKYTLSDIHNPYRHLTNSSLNKSGPRFSECKDRIGNGCKWTLSQVRRALIGRWGATEWLMWQRVRALVTLTLLAQAAGTPPARNCFEFYGFDVLLDDTLKPWLIEVNISPALGADCEADMTVKYPMLHELFDLLELPTMHSETCDMMNTQNGNSSFSGSEDENGGAPKAPPTAVTAPGLKRGPRARRRRALPLHCVNIQPPMSDRYEVTNKKSGSKSCKETEAESGFGQQPIAQESQEETWRGGYATAASRRKMLLASQWGNGVNWTRASGRVGQWVRLFPYALPVDDQIPIIDDIRESVGQVARFTKSARDVVKEKNRDSRVTRETGTDAVFEAILRKKLDYGADFEVWLPSF